MEKVQKILERLWQPSTLKGVTILAGLFGVGIPAEIITSTVLILKGLSGALAGGVAIYEVFRDENKTKNTGEENVKESI